MLPLTDMNLRGASFTADVIAAEVERAVAAIRPRRRRGPAGPAARTPPPDDATGAADQAE